MSQTEAIMDLPINRTILSPCGFLKYYAGTLRETQRYDARQRGAKILAEPREFPGARFAYIGAPDGVIIELLEHRQWAAFLGPRRA